jgi:hypothetical protein
MEKLVQLLPWAMTGTLAVGLLDLWAPPSQLGRPTTVVFAPWTSSATAITNAIKGARLLQTGRFPFAVTVVPDSSDYARTVKSDGAWFVASFAPGAGCAFSDGLRD